MTRDELREKHRKQALRRAVRQFGRTRKRRSVSSIKHSNYERDVAYEVMCYFMTRNGKEQGE